MAAVRTHLEWLVETGVEGLKLSEQQSLRGRENPADGTAAGREGKQVWLAAGRRTDSPAREKLQPVQVKAPIMSGDLFGEPSITRANKMEDLRAAVDGCQRCKLAPGRTNIVFGVGNPQAEIMFVGEGPGADEDAQGEPFVGRAGQLLTRIITNGMKLRREDVYIANIIKCRPPGNRNPEPDEIAACLPFLARQIELIGPEVIVVLGSVAAQALLRTRVPISQLRGVWQEYRGIRVMPTFHPAYLLRNPGQKPVVWEDIKKVMEAAGVKG